MGGAQSGCKVKQTERWGQRLSKPASRAQTQVGPHEVETDSAPVCLCCCRQQWPHDLGKERICITISVRAEYTVKGSQGRDCSAVQAIEQWCRLVCSGLHGADSVHLPGPPPRGSSTHDGLAPPTTFSNGESPHRLAWRPIWLKYFLNWNSLFPDVNPQKSMVSSKEQQSSGGFRLCDSKQTVWVSERKGEAEYQDTLLYRTWRSL